VSVISMRFISLINISAKIPLDMDNDRIGDVRGVVKADYVAVLDSGMVDASRCHGGIVYARAVG